MSRTVKNIFFLGKGGVGKSTSAALTALHLAQSGKKTLLVSLDPAHNQSDIFEKKCTEKPVKICENLWVKEVGLEYWVNKYLKDIQSQVKQTYSYLTAFNLEHYFDVIKFSPGIEEYALLMAYKNILDQAQDGEYLLFDMPPTALTLKFLTLPDLSLKWLEHLMKLREKIIEKRQIITKIKLGNREFEKDKILNRLNRQVKDYVALKKIFGDPSQTVLNLVLNTDKLSFSESELIRAHLAKFHIPIRNLFLNKDKSGFDMSFVRKQYSGCGLQRFPESPLPLIGLHNLNTYLKTIPGFIEL